MIYRKYTIIISMIMISVLLTGCASFMAPVRTKPAGLGVRTESGKELMRMPLPKERVVTAVYKFRDQTGQYKNGGNWSTAVTQGATSILIRALEESRWFTVIEREGLSSLLNERQIIRSSRANYNGSQQNDESLIPPLLFAGMLLEGGIISYDSNVLTGGAGIKYFGLGASGEYREDRVTVYLRAVSTQSGQILKTVYTTKTVLSQGVDVGLYRFVKFKKLLEAETGFTYNEPPELAVTEAIEKAVQSLIIEGILDHLWTLKDSSQVNHQMIRDYLEEKNEAMKGDNFGRGITSRNKIGIGIEVGAQLYSGDYNYSIFRPLAGFSISKPVSEEFTLGLSLNRGQSAASKSFTTTLSGIELTGSLYLLPNSQITPYLVLGAGINNCNAKNKYGESLNLNGKWVASLLTGIGMEYTLSSRISLNALVTNNFFFTDDLDGLNYGEYNDYNWTGRLGLRFYPGN